MTWRWRRRVRAAKVDLELARAAAEAAQARHDEAMKVINHSRELARRNGFGEGVGVAMGIRDGGAHA